MKGRVLVSLFASPFFLAGVWMLWSISSMFFDAWRMQDWQATDATLITAGYKTHRGDSDTYESFATYRYSSSGEFYTGNRVSLGSASDNVGDYQRDTGQRLSTALSQGTPITVLVDPKKPNESIIDASIRWSMVGFKSIFLFVFGGVGLGLLILAWRAPKEKDETLPEYQESPWLLNHDWQSATIRSSSKTSMWGAWAFASIWCLISSPMPFLAYRETVEKQNYVALVGLLFPIIGIGLLVWAIKKTRQWRRFGPTPVTLDPFPGSIGGHVGGTIDTNLPFNAANNFMLTLSSINSYVSGSGKNRSRKEKVLWQNEIVAHSEMTSAGTRVTFRFDVPEGQKQSDPLGSGDDYHLWRLHVSTELSGTDMDRSFDIPVFATSTQSLRLSSHKVAASTRNSNAIYDKTVREFVNISRDGLRVTLKYPMGRNAWSNLAGMLVGGVFAAVGAYLAIVESQRVFGIVFGGTGGLVGIAAFYMLFKSLRVTLDSNTVTSVRRLLGIPIKTRQLQRSVFERFDVTSSKQTRAGEKPSVFHKISAVDQSGHKVLVGDGFEGRALADAAMRLFAKELGLVDRSVA